GTAATLLFGGPINGLPAGWGGAFGLSLGKLADLGIGLIGEPGIAEPFRVVTVALLALTGLLLWYLGLGLRAEERGWLFRRRAGASESSADHDLLEDEEPAERPARASVVAPAE